MSRKYSLTAGILTTSILVCSPAMAASDAEIDALKAQLKTVMNRLNQLEAERATAKPVTASATAATAAAPAQAASAVPAAAPSPAASTAASAPLQVTTSATAPIATAAAAIPDHKKAKGEGEPVVGGSIPGSIKIPGTETTLKLGGYAKLDAIYDNNGYGSQFANFAAIPLNGSVAADRNARFNAHARQSRLNLETHTPTELGDLKTFFEVDFFGSARGNANTTNGEGPQLRQAYGQVGRFLVGQTWSNFMDNDAYPESLDYVGPAGLTFVRQPQIRFTDDITNHVNYAVAIEASNTDFAPDVTPTDTDVSSSNAPDLTGRLQWKDTFGEVSLRGVARKLDASTATGAEDSAFGWGLGLSGRVFTEDKDSFYFKAVYGEGVGRYLFDVAVTQNGSTYVGNHVTPRGAWGGYMAYQHYWSNVWRSNVILGYTGMENGPAADYATSPNRTVASGHVNLIWEPVSQYRVGMEYMHGYRQVESGAVGNLDRVQTSFTYLF